MVNAFWAQLVTACHLPTGRPATEGDGWVIYEEAALVKSSGQSSEPAGQLPTKVTA
jgi:hypothetical protein